MQNLVSFFYQSYRCKRLSNCQELNLFYKKLMSLFTHEIINTTPYLLSTFLTSSWNKRTQFLTVSLHVLEVFTNAFKFKMATYNLLLASQCLLPFQYGGSRRRPSCKTTNAYFVLAPHVRFTFLHISLPFSSRKRREMTKFEVARSCLAIHYN